MMKGIYQSDIHSLNIINQPYTIASVKLSYQPFPNRNKLNGISIFLNGPILRSVIKNRLTYFVTYALEIHPLIFHLIRINDINVRHSL